MKAIKSLRNILLTSTIAIIVFLASTAEANAHPRVRLAFGFPAPVVFVPARHHYVRPHYVWYPGHYRYYRHGHRAWVRGYWRHCY